jgi:hypothetical protein
LALLYAALPKGHDLRDASPGERRAAANNRRTRTRLANAAGNPTKDKKMQREATKGLTNS